MLQMVFLSSSDFMMQAEAQDVPMFAQFPEQTAVSSQSCSCWCCDSCLMQYQRSRRRRKDCPSASSGDSHLGSSPAKYHRTSSSINGSSDFIEELPDSSPHLAHSVLGLTVACSCSSSSSNGQTKEEQGSQLCRHCQVNQNNIIPDLLNPVLLEHNGLPPLLQNGEFSQDSQVGKV